MAEKPIQIKYELRYKWLDEEIHGPAQWSEGASGFDLYADISTTIIPQRFETITIGTGLYLEMPKGVEGQVRTRSSMARKGFVTAGGIGTIDSDYRGEVSVILMWVAPQLQTLPAIEPGQRIAQIVFAKVAQIELLPEYIDTTNSERGENGFGSTGE